MNHTDLDVILHRGEHT